MEVLVKETQVIFFDFDTDEFKELVAVSTKTEAFLILTFVHGFFPAESFYKDKQCSTRLLFSILEKMPQFSEDGTDRLRSKIVHVILEKNRDKGEVSVLDEQGNPTSEKRETLDLNNLKILLGYCCALKEYRAVLQEIHRFVQKNLKRREQWKRIQRQRFLFLKEKEEKEKKIT